MTPTGKTQRNYGLIGCGRFGRFCLEQLRGWPRMRAVAATDAAPALAEGVARDFGLRACADVVELLAREDIDLVWISTPPDTHYALTLLALRAGKHVICEKPIALSLKQADEMLAAAEKAGRLLAVNHMLRYSPLTEVAKRVVEESLLGEPRHYFFENYAEDERLPAGHWFWDRKRSGGIFIEHAVHFFDLYRWWLGPGEILSAQTASRPGPGQIDCAECSLRHGEVLGRQYHGFDQPVRLDRADHRLVFERGDISIAGWIPVELRLDGIVDDEQQARLGEICRAGHLEITERYEGDRQVCRSHGKEYRVTARIALEKSLQQEDRAAVYGNMIKALLEDQLRSLEEPGYVPRLTGRDAREALALAEAAVGKAQTLQ